MLHKYSDYITSINEGTDKKPQVLYWDSNINKLLDKDWSEISSNRYSGSVYSVRFKAGSGEYDYFNVLVEKKGISSELFYLEDPTKFTEKLKMEFWKNPYIYYKNLKYVPKALGDISHLKDSEKFNL